MDSMEIGQFIAFSNSFFFFATKYVVQILLWKTCEEEVILLKTSAGTFSHYYMVQTMGGSHSKVSLNPLMYDGNKRLLYLNKPKS